MTKTRWMLLLVGVIALGMVAHVVIAEDEDEAPRRRPGFRRSPRPGGERPEGRPRRGGRAGEGGEGGQGGEAGRGRPTFRRIGLISPLMVALDKNKDGTLSAAEIKNASKALAKLDKNEDGQITADELRPPRPQFRRRPGGEGGEAGEAGQAGEGGRFRRRPRDEGGPRRGGEGRRRPRPDAEE